MVFSFFPPRPDVNQRNEIGRSAEASGCPLALGSKPSTLAVGTVWGSGLAPSV
jgi:hypothetical protein